MTDAPKPITITHDHGTTKVTINADLLKAELVAAGWAPPFNPDDHHLSGHDFMELATFAGSVEAEGFGYAAEDYPPKFKDETLSAAIGHAPLDRLKKLLAHHREAVDEFWERDDAGDLVDAHQSQK